MYNQKINSVTAFAPATCGNAIVGFDILGLAIAGVGDVVTLTKRDDNDLVITKVDSPDSIPTDPHQNITAVVIDKMRHDLKLKMGFDIYLRKGIPLSSGMGGSAASAAAAVVALNGFLIDPLSLAELSYYALQGEAKFSGHAHPDNIVPALYGGITLITQVDPMHVVNLPIPNIICVLVHPHLQVLTREARGVLAPSVSLKTQILQSAHLAGFISSLYTNDMSLLQASLKDVMIEPQRAHLIRGFDSVKQAALEHGAIGVSLSGAGPSMLAFAKNPHQAKQIGAAMQAAFKQHEIDSEVYLSPISKQGAQIMSIEEAK